MLVRCPKNPAHKSFITTVIVAEEWIVDERGNFIDFNDHGETIHGPDYQNTWICAECDTKAEVEANKQSIKEQEKQ